MVLQDTQTLPNGVAIPKLALGTWMIDDDKAAEAVKAAVEIGYRHIDTAQAYGNERGVGEGVRSCGVPRDELFVQTKLDAGIKDYEGAKAAIDGSLETLGLDYIDLMIIHSPQPWGNFGDTDRYFDGNLAAWKALEEALGAGKVRAIGVSNFQKADLDNLIEHATVKPMINQILAHIGNTPFELIDHAKSQGMLVEAYSPIAHGKILDNAEIGAMAEKYDVSIPQLCIRYILQLDLLALPKTANPKHMKINADVDFEIAAEDMETLKAITAKDYGDASVFPVYSGKV
ncbi:MAG: 2,5-diketo-D-gluconic acid reductase [Alphaproteobacteria bacterium]|nr:2,5-diketo-D-gluconic acid reductase [Alphaproteobacteria bacterium]OUT39389.1 MAG: 2,5-diketo-D-gluconic acid reductase [Micavibrio sp. TMED2]MAS48760.1 2,5-diketo-D-gluconic acid reductase [Alphaproteobacteria bacterium]MAX94375.1 2,5-diketo-D-gluconic acid reductase [Alphaproteobacteria bacterium]MAX94442.1 2,5-diketo-D-gluconic acid reductase [Alphaproteobacteria bacterium]|tara:strand:+ start:11225 stop:12085 length:861 start_codon:yes stop_codon:yes gene_type:complete